MKFTEGYWVRSENMAPSYAAQGFYAERTERGNFPWSMIRTGCAS